MPVPPVAQATPALACYGVSLADSGVCLGFGSIAGLPAKSTDTPIHSRPRNRDAIAERIVHRHLLQYSANGMPPRGERRFQTTRWSLVVAAGGDRSTLARQALATLCEIYWYPLYAYIRRQGNDVEASRDLTQAFFLQLLERHDVQRLRRERGRLRSYLLGAVRHFLANEASRALTLKRGGGQPPVPLEFDAAEGRYVQEPADVETPERLFERRWALTILEQVFNDLKQDWHAAGKVREFELLKDCLIGDPQGGYNDVAANLGTTANAVGVAVHRLRRAFRARLREVIADTVVDEEAVDDEIRHLFAGLGS